MQVSGFRMCRLDWEASLHSELCCYNLQNDVGAALARALDCSSPGFTSCILNTNYYLSSYSYITLSKSGVADVVQDAVANARGPRESRFRLH